MITAKMKEYGTEEIHFCYDAKTGLNAIIAIHSSALGPPTGGTRIVNYANDEDALFDVLRLSRGMTNKNAVAGLNYGGAKGVIICDPAKVTDELLLAYARFVDGLGGKFTTGEDVNMTEDYVRTMATVTKYMAGVSGEGRGGDPSPYTSRGVFRGLQAGAKLRWGSDDVAGKTVAVQGLGKVGYGLCEWLHKHGAKLIVTDINQAAIDNAVAEFGATAVKPEEILFVDCDIFAPNAMGAIIKAEDVPKFKFEIICGGANNVLVNDAAGDAIQAANIMYLPDYVVNAGGVISIVLEIERKHTDELCNEMVDKIYQNVIDVLTFAKEQGIPNYLAADKYAAKIVDDKRK